MFNLLPVFRENTTSRLVIPFKRPIEVFLIEMNVFRKKKLLPGFFNIPQKKYFCDILKEINRLILTTANYEQVFMVSDLITEIKQLKITF